MKPGTKSLLFGEHQVILHGLFLAMAWRRLYGFPWDPRLWACFFLHDIGYWGKPNMDGKEGSTHPELGAEIVHWLFDEHQSIHFPWESHWPKHWYDFCILHSRDYAMSYGGGYVSRLCLADKLAFNCQPLWLWRIQARASGCIHEYYQRKGRGRPMDVWLRAVQRHSLRWVASMRRKKRHLSAVPGYYKL